MSRFKIGDPIKLIRNDRDIVRSGTVIAGPWEVENIDHYNVKWDYDEDGVTWRNMDCDLICDYPSTKYRYI